MNLALSQNGSTLLVIDVQERLFPHIAESRALLSQIEKAIRGFQALQIPLLLTEQVPEKMGETVPEIKKYLPKPYAKAAFSCVADAQFYETLGSGPKEFVLVGIETHVCVLQTARDLINEGFSVTVLRNAVGSRSEIDHFSALEEMGRLGVRLSTVETVLFELIRTASAPQFRAIRDIVK